MSVAATRARAVTIVVIASAAFATSSPLARLARPAHPFLIACGRVAIAGLLLAIVDWRGLSVSVSRLSSRDRRRVALAGLLLAGHFALFQWGLDETSLPAAVSLVSLEPLAVVLSMWAFFGLRPRPLERVGVLLATLGAVVVGQGAGQGEHRLLGDVLVLGAVVLFGFYVASARGLRDALPARHYAALVYIAAACALAVTLPLAPIRDTARLTDLPASSWVMIGLIALVPTIVGHTLVQAAARTLSPSVVALVCPGETLGSILLAGVLIGSGPTLVEAIGGGVILAGAVVAILAQRPSRAVAI